MLRVTGLIFLSSPNVWVALRFGWFMVLHQAPADGGDYSSFHFHIEFHPPLRRPNLLKYLAGPEIGGGNFLSDTAPEEKAEELRAAGGLHYKHAHGPANDEPVGACADLRANMV